jgi:hypothetical protein
VSDGELRHTCTCVPLKLFENISKLFRKCIVRGHVKFLVCFEIVSAETVYLQLAVGSNLIIITLICYCQLFTIHIHLPVSPFDLIFGIHMTL